MNKRFILIACAIFSAGVLVFTTQRGLISDLPLAPAIGLPVMLTIPAIHVNAVIEKVGLTAEGAMDVPKVVGEVAWYELGPRPGETGSAVIDGHYGILKNGESSVFDNVYKLKSGDTLQTTDENGITTSFVVRQIRSYDPKADATDVFTSTDGKVHLNLITCEGSWNKTTKSYSQRLVVFAERE